MGKIQVIVLICLGLLAIGNTESPAGNAPAAMSTVRQKENFASETWQQRWNKILVEARKEAKVLVYGSFSASERTALSKGMKARFRHGCY